MPHVPPGGADGLGSGTAAGAAAYSTNRAGQSLSALNRSGPHKPSSACAPSVATRQDAKDFFRIKSLKGPQIIIFAARHNCREFSQSAVAPECIDETRSHLNFTLTGPGNARGIAELAAALMKRAGLNKQGSVRKNAVRAIELVFSLPASSQVDPKRYFRDCVEWAKARYGGPENVLSAEVHLDESVPHCHVLVLPLLDGRLQGSKLMGDRHQVVADHRSFHASVSSRYGLTTGKRFESQGITGSIGCTVMQRMVESLALTAETGRLHANNAALPTATSIEACSKPSASVRAGRPNPIDVAAQSSHTTLCSVDDGSRKGPPGVEHEPSRAGGLRQLIEATEAAAAWYAGPDTPSGNACCNSELVRSCADCRNLTSRGTCKEPIGAGLIPAEHGFGLAWPEPSRAGTCRAFEAYAVGAQSSPASLAWSTLAPADTRFGLPDPCDWSAPPDNRFADLDVSGYESLACD